MSEIERITARTRAYEGRIMHVDRVGIDFGNGKAAEFELMGFHDPRTKADGAAGVMAVAVEGGEVFLVEQYQAGADRRMLVLPRGAAEDGLTLEAQMQNELQEEIGMRAGRLTRLGVLEPFPGYAEATSTLFLAEELVPSRAAGDELETLTVRRMPLAEAVALVRDGTITDARTVAGLLLADLVLRS